MLGDLGITRGEALRYTLLPQIFPRLKNLFGSGLASLPYFIATVFNTVGILPNGHPALRPESRRDFSVFKVFAQAADQITFDRNNIDKVAFFGLVLTSMVMLVAQFALFILAMTILPAFASTGTSSGYGMFFDNPNRDKDIAFRLLDLVFGIPDIFTGTTETTAFHSGLHALFQFYSYGLLLVGTLIILYLVVRIVLETAESGIPFGERFNKAWAPVRLILFFGLLLPTPNGINLAQYLVLNAAKLGSNVATNAWLTFDKKTKAPYLGSPEQLTARPSTPDLDDFAGFMAIARTCSWAEGRVNRRDIRPYAVFKSGEEGSTDMDGSTPAFADVVKNAYGGTVLVRFGEKDAKRYSDQLGAVFPFCGELAIPVVDQAQPGAAMMQQAYLDLIMCMWSGRAGTVASCSVEGFSDMGRDFTLKYGPPSDGESPNLDKYVGNMQKTQMLSKLGGDVRGALDKAIEKQIKEAKWSNEAPLQLGWAGAGIWFNKIAEQNGALTSAVFSKPIIRRMPFVMDFVQKEKSKQNPNLPLSQAYSPTTSNGVVSFLSDEDLQVARILDKVFNNWGNKSLTPIEGIPESRSQEPMGNIIIDTMNMVMGTQGLFDMCKNTNVHPLAQLASLGKGLVEHSIRGFGVAAGIGIGGGILALLDKQNFAQTIQGATAFFLTFATIGLMLGFVLFYILPFMPFIYFFFAVMTWVKSIFEAMVGLPLWALAHLRIDGEGMPGDVAEGGYFYILEIFLRPVIILISLLGSMLIFAAMVKVLHHIFYLALSNLSGHNVEGTSATCFNPPGGGESGAGTPNEYKRGVIDEFFYTAMYAIVVYMIALPCFKLVDMIPDNIMRWLGSSIQSFGSQDGDPAQNMLSYVTAGGASIGGKLREGLSKGFGI